MLTSVDTEDYSYDLRDLSRWMSSQRADPNPPNDDSGTGEATEAKENDNPNEWVPLMLEDSGPIYTFTELFFVDEYRDEGSGYSELIQHKVFLFVHENNRMTIKSYSTLASIFRRQRSRVVLLPQVVFSPFRLPTRVRR